MEQRVDERDTIFSRIRLEPGTSTYRGYYERRPELQAIDEELRRDETGKFGSILPEAPMVETTFSLISKLRPLVRGYSGEYTHRFIEAEESKEESKDVSKDVRGAGAHISADELTRFLEKNASRYGVVKSGTAEMEERFYYSVRGRGDRYGEEVSNLLPNAFVCAVQMDKDEVHTAPGIREAVEVAGSYLRVAIPALLLASYLRSLGYRAVAHIDGESEVVMPPVAEKAGIGKIGRHGLLVSKTYGSLLRLSVVTTDAPLVPIGEKAAREAESGGDGSSQGRAKESKKKGEASFPLEKACEACGRCADFCPADAIPRGSVIDDWNEAVHSIDHEACFSMWKRFGTDCGVCLAVCPYSKAAPESDRTHTGSGEAASPSESSSKSSEAVAGDPNFLKKYMFGG